MRFTIQNGKHLFTINGQTRAFESFRSSVEWAYITKTAMKIASEI
ncbi:hypothetical protein [Rahnella sp. PCH160]